VGAEYKDKRNRMVKFPVDHLSCMQTLKRAMVECNNEGFSALCLIPTGDRYETITVMQKQAIAVLGLDDPWVRSTITKKSYEQLPEIFAQKSIRISLMDKLEVSAFCKDDSSEKGAFISKKVVNMELRRFIGWRVLDINGHTVVHMVFGDIIKLLFEERKCHTITIDP